MKKLLLFVFIGVIAFFMLVTSGCKSEDEEESSTSAPIAGTDFRGQNNDKLTGPVIGLGDFDNLELKKSLGITIINPSPFLKPRKALATRTNNTDGIGVQFILVVENISLYAFCDVKTVELKFLNSKGEEIFTDFVNKKLISSMGQAESTSFARCIAPTETGYFIQTATSFAWDFYGEVRGIEFDGFVYGSTNVPTMTIKIEAESYTKTDDNRIETTFRNNGYSIGYLWPADTYYILYDESNNILFSDTYNALLVTPTEITSTIDSSADKITVLSKTISYGGSATRVKVLPAFTASKFLPLL